MPKLEVNPAGEFVDGEIKFISLVKKPANKNQFLVVKEEDGKNVFTTPYMPIIKSDKENHELIALVYEPFIKDGHKNWAKPEAIAKLKESYDQHLNVDKFHDFQPIQEGVKVEKSWISEEDCIIGNKNVAQGSWLVKMEITDDKIWEDVENELITGVSMAGFCAVIPEEKKEISLVAKALENIKSMIGIHEIQKGEVLDGYNKKVSKSRVYDNVHTGFYSFTDFIFYEGEKTMAEKEAAIEDFMSILKVNLLEEGDPVQKVVIKEIKEEEDLMKPEELKEITDTIVANVRKEFEGKFKEIDEMREGKKAEIKKSLDEKELAKEIEEKTKIGEFAKSKGFTIEADGDYTSNELACAVVKGLNYDVEGKSDDIIKGILLAEMIKSQSSKEVKIVESEVKKELKELKSISLITTKK